MANDGNGAPANVPSPFKVDGGDEEASMSDYLEALERRTREIRSSLSDELEHSEQTLRMLALAKAHLPLEEADFVFGLNGQAADKLRRVAAKIDGDVNPPQVIDAALTHLEWKVDREAEGLRLVAAEEIDGDELEEDEPWQP